MRAKIKRGVVSKMGAATVEALFFIGAGFALLIGVIDTFTLVKKTVAIRGVASWLSKECGVHRGDLPLKQMCIDPAELKAAVANTPAGVLLGNVSRLRVQIFAAKSGTGYTRLNQNQCTADSASPVASGGALTADGVALASRANDIWDYHLCYPLATFVLSQAIGGSDEMLVRSRALVYRM